MLKILIKESTKQAKDIEGCPIYPVQAARKEK